MRDAAQHAALLALSAARTCAARRGQLAGRSGSEVRQRAARSVLCSLFAFFRILANNKSQKLTQSNGAGPTRDHARVHTHTTHTHWACKALVDGAICSLFCVCGCV